MATRRDRERREGKRTSARDWAKKPSLSGGEATCIKLPDGVSMFKLDKVGTIRIDFLPYRVGKYNRRADEGEEHFELEYDAHRLPTPSGDRLFLCRKCIGEDCAVCDWLTRRGGGVDPEVVKTIRAKTRHLWLINDEPGKVKGTTLKVFDTGHFNRGLGFGELMADAINALPENEEPFVLEGGYTATLTVKEMTAPEMKWNGATRIDLHPHKYNYPESILDDAPCLDDCLVDPGYDKVMAMLETGTSDSRKRHERNGDEDEAPKTRKQDDPGDEDDDDEDDEEPEAPRKKQATAEDSGVGMGATVDHDDFGRCKVVHISRDGTSLRLEDEDETIHSGVSPDDVNIVDENEEERPTKRVSGAGKSTKGGRKTAQTEDDEDGEEEDSDSEDEDEDDEDQDDDSEEDSEDEDDEDQDDDSEEDSEDEDDEEEEEKRPARKKQTAKTRGRK